jgi:hypothetical protein
MKVEKQRKQKVKKFFFSSSHFFKIKEQFEEKDNEMSILQNVALRQVILKRNRKIKVLPNVEGVSICVCGPNADGKKWSGVFPTHFLGNISLDLEHTIISDKEKLQQLIEQTVSGKSLSSYPMKLDLGVREGEPICDR